MIEINRKAGVTVHVIEGSQEKRSRADHITSWPRHQDTREDMKTIREKAERFAVWRMGNLHNWECTYEEAAQATGLTVAQVKRICFANRWRFFDEDGQIEDVDSMMLPQNAVDVSHIHV